MRPLLRTFWRVAVIGAGLLALGATAQAADVTLRFSSAAPPSDFLAKAIETFKTEVEGAKVGVKWELDRTTVVEGEPLIATLVVTGATNPREVVRPDLRKLKAFDDLFRVEDVAGPPVAANAKSVSFAYKLRPRNRTVDRVPALDFYYLNTAAAPGKNPFRMTQADSVTIAVSEPPPPVATEMTEPEHLFHVTTGPEVLHGPFAPCRWA